MFCMIKAEEKYISLIHSQIFPCLPEPGEEASTVLSFSLPEPKPAKALTPSERQQQAAENV